VVGLTVVFVISYVPYHIFWVYYIWTEEEIFYLKKYDLSIDADPPDTTLHYSNSKPQYMYLISTSFLLLNSCLNPVALFCASSPLRQHLKRCLTCFWKTNSPPTDLELERRN
jgi:hypothetical protein